MEANNGANGTKNTRKIISLGLILFTVTAVTGLILGFVHEITAGPIQKTQERLKTEALSGAMPEADAFSLLEVASGSDAIVKDVQEAKGKGATVGYCVTVTPKGYAGPIEIVVGITADGAVRAIRILNQSETPGLGAKAPLPPFSGQFDNKKVDKLTVVKAPPSAPDQVQAISGATITSTAVTDGVNTALDYWKKNLAGGGSR